MTAGPIFYSKPITAVKMHRIYISGFIFSAGLAFLGGSDATRIFNNFFPLYFILILDVLRKNGVVFSILYLLAYAVTNRFGQKYLNH